MKRSVEELVGGMVGGKLVVRIGGRERIDERNWWDYWLGGEELVGGLVGDLVRRIAERLFAICWQTVTLINVV